MVTLMCGLDRTRFTPQMIVMDGRGPYGKLIPPDIHLTDLKGVGTIHVFLRLIRTLRRDRPDIIISTMAPLNFTILAIRPFLKKVKIIVREAITPSYILDGPSRVKGCVARILWRLLYPTADLVLSPTQLVYDEFDRRLHLYLKKNKILENPVDTEALYEKVAESSNPFPATSMLNFVCVGRLHYQKGLDLLLRGLTENQPAKDWSLYIVGDGPERTALEGMAAHPALSGRVRFVGIQDNPWIYMAHADYLLLPSRWEGLPNVVLESLAVGTRVIALTSAGGVVEIARNTQSDDLYIASDMNGFIKALVKAEPGKKTASLFKSRLPDMYDRKNVMKSFVSLLETC